MSKQKSTGYLYGAKRAVEKNDCETANILSKIAIAEEIRALKNMFERPTTDNGQRIEVRVSGMEGMVGE